MTPDGPAKRATSAFGVCRAERDVVAIGSGRAVFRDGLLHLSACLRFGAVAFGGRYRAQHTSAEVFGDQVLDRNRDEFAAAERGVRLREWMVGRVEEHSLLLVAVEASGRRRSGLEVQLRHDFIDAPLLSD